MKMILLFCLYVCAAGETAFGSEVSLSDVNLSKLLDDYEDAKIRGEQGIPVVRAIKDEILKRMNDPTNKEDIKKYVDPQKIERFTKGSSVAEFTRAIWDAHPEKRNIKGAGAKILVLDGDFNHRMHVKDIAHQIAPLAQVEDMVISSQIPDFSAFNAVNLSLGALSLNYMSLNLNAIFKSKPLLIYASGNDSCFLNQLCNTVDKEGLNKVSPDLLEQGYILVGALDYGNMIGTFSNKPGNDPHTQNNFIWTLGEDVLAKVGRSNLRKGGTSMAAPVVTGVAALIAGKYDKLTKEQIKISILKSARKEFIIENTEAKIMVHVSKNPDASILMNDKNGYLHVYQPYHAYIWGQGILDVEGALKYGGFLSQGEQNIDQKWGEYLKEKKEKEASAATKIQSLYRGFKGRKPKLQDSSLTSHQVKDWIASEDSGTSSNIAHKLLIVYQMNSPVLSKMILEGYVQQGQLTHDQENLAINAMLLKIALNLAQDPAEKNFALRKIQEILEHEPIDKKIVFFGNAFL